MVNRLVSDNFRENRQISGRGCTSKYPKRCDVHLPSPWVCYGKTDAKQPIVTTFPTTFAWYHPHHNGSQNMFKMKLAPKTKSWLCFFPHARTNPDCFEGKHSAGNSYIYIYIHIKPKDQGFPRNVPFVNCHFCQPTRSISCLDSRAGKSVTFLDALALICLSEEKGTKTSQPNTRPGKHTNIAIKHGKL